MDGSKSKPDQELKDLFLDFLKAVAKKATDEFGPNPKRLQRSKWMVKDGPSRRSSKIFERDVFDSLNIFKGGFRITDELQSLKTNLSIFSILTM